MKIDIVGGGPAGLYFAILMKRRDPATEVVVHERRPRGQTYGFGIIVPRPTLDTVRDQDPPTRERLDARLASWDGIDVVHPRGRVCVRGNVCHGVARLDLLRVLEGRCAELGVEVRFEDAVADPERLRRACDLLVGADGFNSVVRRAFEATFEPALEARTNRHAWYGTSRPFECMTLAFLEHEAGVLVAHAYPASATESTFIVECDGETWARAGFDARPDADARGLLAKAFRRVLGGRALRSNRSTWGEFTRLANRRWVHENVVLLGDALHTVHFSTGSGTSLALDDAGMLARAFDGAPDVATALAAFEQQWKPKIEAFQAMSDATRAWIEGAKAKLDLEPLAFARHLLGPLADGGRARLAEPRRSTRGK